MPVKEERNAPLEVAVRPTGLEELDVLGEALLKESLPRNSKVVSNFQKPQPRVPLNLLAKQKADAESVKETISVGNSNI